MSENMLKVIIAPINMAVHNTYQKRRIVLNKSLSQIKHEQVVQMRLKIFMFKLLMLNNFAVPVLRDKIKVAYVWQTK